MVVVTLQVGQVQTNCYLYNGLIIDPGDDAEYIYNKIQALNFSPKAIVATHGHFDHLLAVNELKAALDIPFLIHKKDKVMLSWYRKSCKHFLGFDPGPAPKPDSYLQKGVLKTYRLETIETPGHTPGGVCLYNKKECLLFSGDTIFANGAVGRTDFPYCNKQDLEKSIEKLVKLPTKTIVYPGHGETTTIRNFGAIYTPEA